MSDENQILRKLAADLDFDPVELREKYRTERDRRVTDSGKDQYTIVSDKLAHFATDDPYVEEEIKREPLDIETNVLMIGGGFSGLMTGARLQERGITDFKIIEAGSDFGGTWYWNRYPGAQCDVDSYCYLPMLEETGYMPKEKYSLAPEIYEHTQRLAKHFNLYDHAIFQTRVTEVRWDTEIDRWRISTNRGDDIRARFVIQGTGPMSKPKLPGIEGIDAFKGHMFHTCRWDYEYTGGDHTGGMTGLADKRVAIIGTGATAIQCVPFVAKDAEKLLVFQRTPSSVDLRGNKPTDEEWFASLEPGWQRERRKNFSAVLLGEMVAEDLVNDGWTDIVRRMGNAIMQLSSGEGMPNMAEILLQSEISDFEKMNEVRARVDSIVDNEETAELLKPWYRQFCKRPTFNDMYLECFNRDNVELVDTSFTQGVERITEKGLVANGQEFEVDCIIFATGFEATTNPRCRVDFDTIGKDGQSLYDHWEDGFRTLHGIMAHGFPNWFTIGINQNALSPNFTSMFDDLAVHISHIISEVLGRGHTVAELTSEAEDAWVQEVIATTNPMRNSFFAECTPGFYNDEGKKENLQNLPYGPGINAFNSLLEGWRESGNLEGLSLR